MSTAEHPLSARETSDPAIRVKIVGRFHYKIFYSVGADEMCVTALVAPGYWTTDSGLLCRSCAIGASHDQRMGTVAEGVETEEQLVVVRAAGCTHAQGFLFGRPRPAANLKFRKGR
ncbi:MAG: EAL domain-containing protein [Bradyrhizobiaceae bacterium]|nr:EAL domain-containing protein [Bradyrhizobiaceae bacterium]